MKTIYYWKRDRQGRFTSLKKKVKRIAEHMFWLMIAIMMLNFVTPFAQMAYEQIHLTYVHSHMVYAAPPHPKQPIEVTILTEHELASLTDYLFRRAEEAGVTPNLVRKVIYCESQWTNTQSRIVTADGSREDLP